MSDCTAGGQHLTLLKYSGFYSLLTQLMLNVSYTTELYVVSKVSPSVRTGLLGTGSLTNFYCVLLYV